MTLPKLLALSSLILFSVIGVAAYVKKGNEKQMISSSAIPIAPIEIELDQAIKEAAPVETLASPPSLAEETSLSYETVIPPNEHIAQKSEKDPPEEDRVAEFFNLKEPKFPIVETITYKSRVPWQKGRPAWLSDYAGHFKTSRHFIARSLNGQPDYLKQDLAEGASFNILKPDKNIQFHLIIDTTRCKMWFYYHDLDTKEKVLVKTYPVAVGREDYSKISGLLTPLGIYSLGSRIATYKPKVMGMHNGSKTEMIRVFGTRWIPFETEIKNTTAPAKGFGIHGLPWTMKNEKLVEDFSSLGKHESDGCIRMASSDIEELYAIIITRPTTVEIVKDFFDAENKIQPIPKIEVKNKLN